MPSLFSWSSAIRANTLALALAVTLTTPALADSVVLTPTKDATLIEDAQGDFANGGEDGFQVGHTNQGGAGEGIRRGILAFNLSSIPAGSTINSVTLKLTAIQNNASGNFNITLHKVLADWGEGTSTGGTGGGSGGAPTTNSVTWIHRFFSGTNWSTAGGQFTAGSSATLSVGATGAYTWSSAGMITDVSNWVNNSSTNFGWIVRGNETTLGSTKKFASRTFATTASRPTLTVDFTPPTGACCLVDGTCVVVTQASCNSQSGTYQGNNTSCSPNPCPPPTGACCLPNQTCVVLEPADCTTQGGTYQGHGTSCSPSPCIATITDTFGALQDTTIYENATGNSNGAGEFIITGTTGSIFTELLSRNGLIKFDLSSIPSNATVISATLTLRLLETNDSASRGVSIYRVTQSWGEAGSNAVGDEYTGAAAQITDANWTVRSFPFTAWSTPGGAFATPASATTTVSTILNTFHDFTGSQVAANVQQWIQNPSQNHGWIILSSNALGGNALRGFGSRNNPTRGNQPVLEVQYQVIPATGACCFPDGSCQVNTQVGCSSAGGFYNGDNTNCSPNLCPQPTGSCCLPSGFCVTVTAANCLASNGTYNGDNTLCADANCPIILTPYIDALPIPGTAVPTTGSAGGAAHYDIDIVETTHRFHSELSGDAWVWAYDGKYPGDTIEAFKGQTVTVNWFNNLRNEDNSLKTQHRLNVDTCLHGPDVTGNVPVTVVHLHGAKVASESDGDPDTAFPPGTGAPLYTYPNNQPACTMWYHDHALGITRLNVYMGLAGFYLLRDTESNALNLPQGHNDIPLVIQDRSFHPTGQLKYNTDLQEDFFGEFVCVNGKVWPFLDVRKGKYRFRLLNGSNSRTYTLALSNNATFHLIATDLGMTSTPVPLTSITLSPAERAEIVVDFAPYSTGTTIEFVNSAVAPFPNGTPGSEVPQVMQFRVTNSPGDTDALPATLVPVTPMNINPGTIERSLELRNFADAHCPGHDDGTWMINGLLWDDITEFPRENATEIWSWVNRSPFTHPMHMHLVRFQILDRQAFTIVSNVVVPTGPLIPPSPSETGWKDTVQASPNMITRVAARFEGFTGLFPYHCHILEHEDHEMMRQFRVVCVADFDDGSGTGQPDGGVTIDDLLYYLNAFNAGTLNADVDDGTATGNPDGGVTIDDLLYYLNRFNAGC
ncbi:MAG: multicopper oxidase family protein [Phycisphaerales bacterium]|nr:MAG: multicopper oxidase family protein [Phycisphaerales bacterium]